MTCSKKLKATKLVKPLKIEGASAVVSQARKVEMGGRSFWKIIELRREEDILDLLGLGEEEGDWTRRGRGGRVIFVGRRFWGTRTERRGWVR